MRLPDGKAWSRVTRYAGSPSNTRGKRGAPARQSATAATSATIRRVSADVEQKALEGVRKEGIYGTNSGPLSECTYLGAKGEDAGGYASYGVPAS